MDKFEPYETLCNNHNQIMFNLKEIKKLVKGNKEAIEGLNVCLEYVRYCKKQGQHMENRMRKYRSAIEELGFSRTK